LGTNCLRAKDGVSLPQPSSQRDRLELLSKARPHSKLSGMSIWGTVPSYFGGIALILTVVVILRDHGERVRGQANQVAAWVQRSSTEGVPHRVVVKNASDLPCTHVGIWITEGYRSPTKTIFSKAFGLDTDRERKPRYLHAVGPDETVVVYETKEDVAVRQMTLTDATGRHWVRVDGRLMRDRRTAVDRISQLLRRARNGLKRVVIFKSEDRDVSP
jgi:hypothetical protein